MARHVQPSRTVIDAACFWSQGGKFEGHGVLDWHPDEGFSAQLHVERTVGEPPQKSVSSGRPYVLSYVTLRMELRDGTTGFALAPIRLSIFDEKIYGRVFVEVTFSRAIFFDAFARALDPEQWFGTCELRNEASFVLPDTIRTKEWIEGERAAEGFSRTAFRHDDDVSYLRGKQEDTVLRFVWQLASPSANRRELWRWPEALRDTMTVMTTSPTALDRTEIMYGSRRRLDVRKHWKLNPIISEDFIPHMTLIEAEMFMRLVRFFADTTVESRVASRIVNRVVEAFQLPSTTANEITVSTALEAALRTLFSNTKKRWVFKTEIERFRLAYGMGDEWKDVHKDLEKCWNWLRGQAAHPNWLERHTRAESRASRERGLAQRSYVIRYYGYMIRAMAGERDMSPEFPELPK